MENVYHNLLAIHIISVIIFCSSLITDIVADRKILIKLTQGLFGLATLVSGGLLMQRFGLILSNSLPVWIKIKISIWLVLIIITPIVTKRFKKVSSRLVIPWFILFSIACYMSIFKPL